MPDDKNYYSESDHDLDGTQPVESVDTTKHLPPPPPGRSHVQLPSRPQQRKREKRKREERAIVPQDTRKSVELKRVYAPRDRSKSGLYLPAWSVLLMLFTVFIVAFGIIALVIALGGGAEPGGSPRILIITAVPTDTPLASEPSATSILLPDESQQSEPVPFFPLEGPTLLPVVLSPTPISVQLGSTVFVNAEGGLNVRAGAGLDNPVLFNADNGAVFVISDGPIQANGLTWWEIRDPDDADRFGWAAADYLEAQTQ
jgi:hypothetical protein